MMKKYILLLVTVLVFGFCCQARAEPWKNTTSTHFIIYYKNAPEDFLNELIEKAEGYYDKIADDLGFRRFDFWLWDNRAKIYIYDNAQDYQQVTGHPAWSSGCAYPRQKIIHTFPYAKKFFDVVLPHEMGHIIFREFVGFDNSAIPIWLDEGVASYEQPLKFSEAQALVKEARDNNRLMSLQELFKSDPQLMSDTYRVSLFYAQSVSIVDYLVKKLGQDTFVSFCQQLRDKNDFEKALSSNYNLSNISELDEDWRRYLR
jgi:hypothetical protein